MAEQQQQPTAEDVQKSQSVASAGAEAAANAPTQEQAEQDARAAMRKEADRVNLEIPDEIIEKIAKAVSSQNIEDLRKAGAFDPPPENVQPPPQPTAPPPPGEQATASPAGDTGAEPPPQAPQKQTFAHRFLGA